LLTVVFVQVFRDKITKGKMFTVLLVVWITDAG
jgi:hypothetical protein